jgi:hypothetical protein
MPPSTPPTPPSTSPSFSSVVDIRAHSERSDSGHGGGRIVGGTVEDVLHAAVRRPDWACFDTSTFAGSYKLFTRII